VLYNMSVAGVRVVEFGPKRSARSLTEIRAMWQYITVIITGSESYIIVRRRLDSPLLFTLTANRIVASRTAHQFASNLMIVRTSVVLSHKLAVLCSTPTREPLFSLRLVVLCISPLILTV